MRWLFLITLSLCSILPALAVTDDETAAANDTETPPAVWAWPTTPVMPMTVFRGLWTPMYRLDEATAYLSGASIAQGIDPGFPYAALQHQRLLVIANLPGAYFTPLQRARIKTYVAHGGALLLLGGFFTDGATFRNTLLEEIAPVTFDATSDRQRVAEGLIIQPGPDAATIAWPTLNWAAKPCVYWYHHVTPRAGAQVVLTAGTAPLLITGSYGKGKVAVFAGSILGEAAPGQTAFWTWNDWPKLMSGVLSWLTQGQPTTASIAIPLRDINTEIDKAMKRTNGVTRNEMQVIESYCDRPVTTAGVNRLLSNLADIKCDISELVALNLFLQQYHQVDATCRISIKALVHSPYPYKAALGLRLLGALGTAQDVTLLTQTIETGTVPAEEEGNEDGGLGNDLNPEVDAMNPAEQAQILQIATADGICLTGAPTAVSTLKTLYARLGPTSLATWNPAYPRQEEQYRQTIFAALRCGDASAADESITLMLRAENLLQVLSEFQSKVASQQVAAQQACYHLSLQHQMATGFLAQVPETVLPALAARLARDEDPRLYSLAVQIFSNRTTRIPPPVLVTLAGSRLPAIATLAKSLMR